MLVIAALLAGTLAVPALAAAPPTASSSEGAPSAARELRAQGDALRKAGDYEGALRAYQAEKAAAGESAEVWKRIGWSLKGLRRFGEAARALRRAAALDPQDREARDDLEDLELSRGLRLQGWLGGDEPGTSRNAVNAQLWYGGVDRLELVGGYGWTDQGFYQSNKGFASAYWFYAPDSYLMADLTYRKYDYPLDAAVRAPNPDTTSYEVVPRGTLEMSHWFGRSLRAVLAYQLYAPNFWHDKSTRVYNHKLSGELGVPLGGGLQVGLMVAALRDPDPGVGKTRIQGRYVAGSPVSGNCDPGNLADPNNPFCARDTRVVYRVEPLVGGFVAYRADRWGAEVRGIPNRDLDAAYRFSVISALTLSPQDRLELQLQWVFDSYASTSSFPNRTGNILWATARYRLTRALALGGGVKYVDSPLRTQPVLLLDAEYRTGLF